MAPVVINTTKAIYNQPFCFGKLPINAFATGIDFRPMNITKILEQAGSKAKTLKNQTYYTCHYAETCIELELSMRY